MYKQILDILAKLSLKFEEEHLFLFEILPVMEGIYSEFDDQLGSVVQESVFT